jgi:hypothetical protein
MARNGRSQQTCSSRIRPSTRTPCPDGRSFDDQQILLFTLDGPRVRSVDQFVGDPPAVTAFWA